MCRKISALEYYMKALESDENTKWSQVNSCSICMCELYDEIEIPDTEDGKHD